jgi:hypothetical protein
METDFAAEISSRKLFFRQSAPPFPANDRPSLHIAVA